MELWQPLAVQDIALASGHVLDLSGIDQHPLEASGFEDLIQGNPVHAGGFHGHRVDATLHEPVAERMEIRRKRLEATDAWRIALHRHRHKMLCGSDIDADGIQIQSFEGGRKLAATSPSSKLSLYLTDSIKHDRLPGVECVTTLWPGSVKLQDSSSAECRS